MIILHEQKTPVYVAVAVNACIRVGCNRPLMRFSPTKICVIQFRRLSSQALYSQIGCNRKSKLFFDGLFFPLHTKSMKPFLLAWYNQYDTEIWATKNIFKKMQKKLRFKLCFVSQLYKKLLSTKWNCDLASKFAYFFTRFTHEKRPQINFFSRQNLDPENLNIFHF